MVDSLDELDSSLVLSDAPTELDLSVASDDDSVLPESLLPPSVDAELSVEPELDSLDDASDALLESLESVDRDEDSSVEPAGSVVPLPSTSPDPSYVEAKNTNRIRLE